ncbi:DUF4142 domain-containing protein [Pedobacter sp. ASV1-7]|uniref:DUF4142 domain-containing protein n=1 Tax=Pedobacter sp. ASV1-7 TaxID=3145237 RepID=UPI0032E87BDE
MKNHWIGLWIICLIGGLQACNNAQRSGRDETAKEIVDSLSDTSHRAQALTADVDLNGDGKVFILSVANGGMMEVEAAGIAIKRTKNKLVKDFAEQMLKDHGAANAELKGIADAKGLGIGKFLPDEMAADLAKLNGLEERAFDLQYMRMMINDHQKTVELFTSGTRLEDAELRAFAVKTLPLIKGHYQTAMAIGKKMNISNANNGDDVLGISPGKVEGQ